MAKKYEIETVKTEKRGFIPQTRKTVRDSDGQVRTGDFKSTAAEADRDARDRLSNPPPKPRG
jgi:hypothetical protein